MTRFKRDIKGYYHLLILQVFLLYGLFTEHLQIMDALASVVILILLLRFVLTDYLIISETELIINRDFFTSKTILINEIQGVIFGSWFTFGKINLKNGSSVLFKDRYLSSDAKAALLKASEGPRNWA